MKALNLKHIFHKELDAIYGKNEVERFFFLSLGYYLHIARIQLALDPEFTLSKSETNVFFKTLESLKQQKPIQYILGETEFYGLRFMVNEDVLIPRPETEELVDLIIKNHNEAIIKESNRLRILDIGTGSGCIAISLAKYMQNAEVFALDVSEKALDVAKKNAELNNIDVTFIKGDILNEIHSTSIFKDIKFDIIVSNPPYVRQLEKEEMKPNVLDNEPHLALFVENENPLQFYKAITDFAIDNLKQGGHLYFEINQYLGEETKGLLINSNFKNIELLKDLNGNDRILKGRK